MLSVALCIQCCAIPPVLPITNSLSYKLTPRKHSKCSTSHSSAVNLTAVAHSASTATIRLKQEKKKKRLQFCYFFLMVDIFQSVYGLSHFPTLALEKPISHPHAARDCPCFCPSSYHHTQPISQIQRGMIVFHSSHSSIFPHMVGLGRKGCAHT